MLNLATIELTEGLMTADEKSMHHIHLWKQLKEGKMKALDALYDQYIDALYAFGLSFSSDTELVKDSIQDLFLELYKYRKKLSDTDNIKNYLFKSLKRKIFYNQSKTLKVVYKREVFENSSEKKESVEENIINIENSDAVKKQLAKAIEELPYRQREAITLKYKAELPYGEVAKILNVSVESARTLIYRAIKSLKESVAGKIDDDSIILLFIQLTTSKK